ncbi:MAG TPA: tRNA (adenosine(37)-N6)-threonylcarbamoyltransferase complex dimerization subunit type 1 TsaB [Candidatus Eisenbacteria bacterium]|nr:tRNA (adenosine(37)-N6)-threonylcarbamoyltransferase complex dimerization subunit type 1 TsaB [Candidatus Eisenbacteria bacterium]
MRSSWKDSWTGTGGSMRYTLGIDTAAPDGSVALAADGRAVAVEPLLPREHSSGLSLAVDRLLASRSLSLHDVTGVAVSEGPGSFTGLRIGLAWAKGFALGRGIPIALVSAHAAAAHADRGGAGWIATVHPSERGFVEIALWNGRGESAVWGPEKVEIEDAVARAVEAARSRSPEGDLSRNVVEIELRPATAALLSSIAEDAADVEVPVRPPGPLGAAVAEIGDRLLASGAHADLVLAAPAYGREPNARKPGS